MGAASVATVPCATCGGPTTAEAVPPELERWMSLVRPVCAPCIADAEAADKRREAEVAARRRMEIRAKRLEQVGVSSDLVGYGFKDIDRPEGLERALELAGAWARGELLGVGLFGPTGTGKSRVGVAAANEACWRTRVRWYSAAVLIARLGQGEFASKQREAALEALTGNCALVLDDIDKARPTEYAAEQLFMAVDARADGGGQLLVTTNLRGQEMAKRWPQPYGEALADRLQLLTWTRVVGESKRGNGRGAV
jgi:DNA replication protein DnaC